MTVKPNTGTLVELAVLKPFPGNAKRHDMATIKGSLTVNRQYRPIVVAVSDDPEWDGVILAGNGTADAAHELGWKKIAVTYYEGTVEEFRSVNLVDNRSNDRGWYDDEALVANLELMNGNYEGTGYSDDDVAALIGALHHAPVDGGDGPPDPGELWPVLKIRMSPDALAQWRAAGEKIGSDDDSVIATAGASAILAGD